MGFPILKYYSGFQRYTGKMVRSPLQPQFAFSVFAFFDPCLFHPLWIDELDFVIVFIDILLHSELNLEWLQLLVSFWQKWIFIFLLIFCLMLPLTLVLFTFLTSLVPINICGFGNNLFGTVLFCTELCLEVLRPQISKKNQEESKSFPNQL